jgi:hypothetical protein
LAENNEPPPKNDILVSLGLTPPDSPSKTGSDDPGLAVLRAKLQAAFRGFYLYPQFDAIARRTRLQQRLIAASDANCIAFKSELYAVQAWFNFGTGSAALATTAAGAIVTDAPTARLLSGIGSAITGFRAEGNDDFFRKMYFEAISQAIDSKRLQLRTDMVGLLSRTIDEYPVEAAIADAIRYNNACSLVEGVALVQHAVSVSDDPAGLVAFRDAMSRAGYSSSIILHQSGALGAPGSSGSIQTGQASGGPAQVKTWLAQLSAEATLAENALASDDPARQSKIAAIEKSKSTLVSTTPDNSDPNQAWTGAVLPYITQLTNLSANYDVLLGRMRVAQTEEDRQHITSLLSTNDSDAASVLAVVKQEIDDVTASFPTSP